MTQKDTEEHRFYFYLMADTAQPRFICVNLCLSVSSVCYKNMSLYIKKQLKTPIHLGAKGENIYSFTPSISSYNRISLKNYRFSINFSRKSLVV